MFQDYLLQNCGCSKKTNPDLFYHKPCSYSVTFLYSSEKPTLRFRNYNPSTSGLRESKLPKSKPESGQSTIQYCSNHRRLQSIFLYDTWPIHEWFPILLSIFDAVEEQITVQLKAAKDPDVQEVVRFCGREVEF